MNIEVPLAFRDISNEQARTYVFPGGETITVEAVSLHVSDSGGHRLIAVDGTAHYIPPGWLHLFWAPKPGQPPFRF